MNQYGLRLVALCIALLSVFAPLLARAADGEEQKPSGAVHLVTVTNDNQFVLVGKTHPMEQLAKRLKSAGAKSDNEIRVQIPRDTPVTTLQKISALLMTAGYSKFVFVKPRRAESIPGK